MSSKPQNVSPRLLSFVRSRLPMVEHDFQALEAENSLHAAARIAAGKYAITQAFFYAAELWIDKPPLVSKKAMEYAITKWGGQCQRLWTLKRAEIPVLDGCKISESGLIYEHVTTGTMFREHILLMLQTRQHTLDPFAVSLWLAENYQTAWIHRDEDKELTRQGFRSYRGTTLTEARKRYEKCGIVILDRPLDEPKVVSVGHTELDDPPSTLESPADNTTADQYTAFFGGIQASLQDRGLPARVSIREGRPYALFAGFTGPESNLKAWVVLERTERTKVRRPVLSLEAVSGHPGQEPTIPEWVAMRKLLDGHDWNVSYGSHQRIVDSLCRYKKNLTVAAFNVGDEVARGKAAEETSLQLEALWSVLNAASTQRPA